MKLIALDLDGTLLNSKKQVSPRTYRALEMAAAKGYWIVPATGRAVMALPDEVLSFPFLRYVISVNGACVSDQIKKIKLFTADIPKKTALDLISFAKQFDCMYDCYWNDIGWANKALLDRIRYYNRDEEVIKLILRSRRPVDDLESFIQKNADAVQKLQLCFRNLEEREIAKEKIQIHFPDITATSSFRNNLELNWKTANKGSALLFLANHLQIPASDTFAFGDSSNDLSMLRAAGTGIATGNAADEIKEACAVVTETNDCDGVAVYLEKYIL